MIYNHDLKLNSNKYLQVNKNLIPTGNFKSVKKSIFDFLKFQNIGKKLSFFKNKLKGKFIITNVTFKLTKHTHKINISYGAIQTELENKVNPTLKEISEAIIAIRQSKLPDPKEIGNSGSFFKNPVIEKKQFKEI